jgi:D-arabinose 1-dehydrogenase-like Zn-dependent alcohol dehydrogenase
VSRKFLGVDEALERLGKGDVRYRFVLDLSDLDD